MSFDRRDRFSAVVAQQGRVTLDADHNEQTAILQHHLRTLATDLLGRHAWPSADPGFEVALVLEDGHVSDLSIGAGRCYVDGILVENPARPSGQTTFYEQPDAYFERGAHELPSGSAYFVYLEVWERLVTFIEDPEIRDPALGGADSCARTKVVWQARFHALDPGEAAPETTDAALEHWRTQIEPQLLGVDVGTMVADVPREDDEDRVGAPLGGYRGSENRLYRVEIHSGGALRDPLASAGAAPTFKWSRDNGSVVYPIHRDAQAVYVATRATERLREGDWVELVDDASVLNGEPTALRRVTHIDAGGQITFDAAARESTGAEPGRHPLLRRWDQQPSEAQRGADNAIELTGEPFALEDGIEVCFSAGSYRAADYWVFPARVETRDIAWPRRGGVPVPRAPDGVRRSYAPLALVQGPSTADVIDLRRIVEPR